VKAVIEKQQPTNSADTQMPRECATLQLFGNVDWHKTRVCCYSRSIWTLFRHASPSWDITFRFGISLCSSALILRRLKGEWRHICICILHNPAPTTKYVVPHNDKTEFTNSTVLYNSSRLINCRKVW